MLFRSRQIGGVVGRAEIVRVGDALFTQLAQFLATLGDDLVFVRLGRGVRLIWFGHDGSVVGKVPQRQGECVNRRGLGAAAVPDFGQQESRYRQSCVQRDPRRAGTSNALFQAGADERIEVAVEHALRIADFDVGAQILDTAVVQHVRADLVTPAHIGLAGFELVLLLDRKSVV